MLRMGVWELRVVEVVLFGVKWIVRVLFRVLFDLVF